MTFLRRTSLIVEIRLYERYVVHAIPRDAHKSLGVINVTGNLESAFRAVQETGRLRRTSFDEIHICGTASCDVLIVETIMPPGADVSTSEAFMDTVRDLAIAWETRSGQGLGLGVVQMDPTRNMVNVALAELNPDVWAVHNS